MSIFTVLDNIDSFLWTFLGVPIVIILGLYLSFKEKFYQLRQAGSIAKTIYSTQDKEDTAQNKQGIHPLKAFFTSIGGRIGIGNIVAVCTAIKIGGPGSVFGCGLLLS